jgi:hypothetical protein
MIKGSADLGGCSGMSLSRLMTDWCGSSVGGRRWWFASVIAMLALTMLGCGGTSAGSSSTSASTESSPQPDSSVAPASTRPAQSADVQAISNQVLALDPRVPGDVNLFTSQFNPGAVDGLYPSGSAMEPGSTPALTEEEVRHQLSGFLTTWHGDDAKESAALALFDDTLVKLMVPEPDNRAAFVCLAGTIWEPLIDYYLHSDRFKVTTTVPTRVTKRPFSIPLPPWHGHKS